MRDLTTQPTFSSAPQWYQRTWLPILLLILVVGAAYANCLNCALIWDDIPTIVDTHSFEHLATVFAPSPEVTTASGRPVLSLSLWFNYTIAKRDLVGLHLTNVLIHLTGVLTLFGLVRRAVSLPACREVWGEHAALIAFSVAALWAAHPLQTESVTYVVQRCESMMGVSYLLTLYCFIRGITSPRSLPWLTASILACAVGMGSKEVMVSAPVIVLLFDRTFVSGSFGQALRSRKLYYFGLASTWIILGYLVISLGGDRQGGTGGFSAKAAWLDYWATQFRAIAIYLKLTFFPHPLVFQYGPRWVHNLWEIIPYAAIVIPLAGATLYALVRSPRAGFLGFWFFSILAPTSIIPGTTDIIVEHRMYLALAPLLTLVVTYSYARIGQRSCYLFAALALVLVVLTVRRNAVYQTAVSLWEDTVAKSPDFALGHFNLAAALLPLPNRTEDAIYHLKEATRILPGFARAHFNLGIALSQYPEKKDEAYAHYAFALRLQPRFPEAQNNMGILLQSEGHLPQAIEQYRAALQAKPDAINIRHNLARALSAAEDTLGAVAEYEEMIKLEPNNPQAHYECGSLLANTGHFPEAISHLESALKLAPGLTEARYLLGMLLSDVEGRGQESIALLEQTLREKPGYAEVHFNLGNALGHFPDRYLEAIAQFEAAVKLKPDYAEAHFNLATALESFPNRSMDALQHYREYSRLQPGSADGHLRIARILAADPLALAEARREAQIALRLEPDSSEARELLRQLQVP